MNSRLLLLGSVSLNLGLACALWLLPKPVTPAPTPAPSSIAATPTPRSPRLETGSPPAPAPATPPPSPQVAQLIQWRQIEAADYHEYVANLRAIGCPEQTLQDIILADVEQLYAERVRELVDTVHGQFWDLIRDEERLEAMIEAKRDELGALGDQQKELIRELLGDVDR